GEKDRPLLRRRPQGSGGRGHRAEVARGDEGGVAEAADDERPAGRCRDAAVHDEGVVRHGQELRPLLQPGRHLRRHPQVPEDLTMDTHLQRALVLLEQSRYDLAEKELRLALASEPDNAIAHGFLAMCLNERDEYAGATEEAEAAIRLAPDWSEAHAIRAR